MNIVYESSFEEGFYDYQDKGELTCPINWVPDWIQGIEEGILDRPEYDAKDKTLGHSEVYEGRYAAAIMQTSATHNCCLWRRFSVEPGEVVALATVMIKSHRSAGHGLVMGIDPSGGEAFKSDSVIWGSWWSQHMDEYKDGNGFGSWHPLEVRAVTQGTIITVFLKSVIDYPAQWGAGIWGEFKLWDSGSGPVEGNEQVVEDLRGLQVGIYRQIEDLIIKYSG